MQKWAGLVPRWQAQFKGERLLGCLLNTFIYIEIGGTGGSAFRTMYARFLEEAGIILDNPALNDTAQKFRESGKKWSQIAGSALPDTIPALNRTRELLIRKNRIFEEQRPGAVEKMIGMNIEVDEAIKLAAGELDEKSRADLLTNMQHMILECHRIENEAFMMLNDSIKNQ